MTKKIYLVYPKKIGTIAPEIYGHFIEHLGGVIYDGLWVGKKSTIPNINGFRKDLVEKFKAIKPTVLRWPGGCFAELYDWRDGIGENRPVRVSWWSSMDDRMEDNSVGTHEFLDFCELIGAKPYIAVNMATMPPLDMRRWMEYCMAPEGATTLALERAKNGHPEPYKIPYWGVGNENWEGGGNMRPEYYVDEFRKYSIMAYNVSTNFEYIACGPNNFDYDWTQKIMPSLASSVGYLHGLSMHYYCDNQGDGLNFTDEEWNQLLAQANKMEEIICRNWAIISGYGMEEKCRLVVDEWGCWYHNGTGPSNGQNLFETQNTMRDAMVAALTLNIFNRHCDKVKMANVAQAVNCIHSLFLAGGENCIVTPTYHVFDMYKGHQGGEGIETIVTENEDLANSLTVSASVKDGKTLISIGNLSCSNGVSFVLESLAVPLPTKAKAKLLHHEDIHAHNTFEKPDTVTIQEFEIDPTKSITIPKAGIMTIEF